MDVDVLCFERKIILTPHHADDSVAVDRLFHRVDDVATFFESSGLAYLVHSDFSGLSAEGNLYLDWLASCHERTSPITQDESRAVDSGQVSQCCLCVVDSLEPCLVATGSVQARHIFGTYCMQLMERRRVPPIWEEEGLTSSFVFDLAAPKTAKPSPNLKPVALCLSAVCASNVFRFLRNCRWGFHERTPNVALELKWWRQRPHLICRALCHIKEGTELIYDWDAEVTRTLAALYVCRISLASHALHDRLVRMTDLLQKNSYAVPPWPTTTTTTSKQKKEDVVNNEYNVWKWQDVGNVMIEISQQHSVTLEISPLPTVPEKRRRKRSKQKVVAPPPASKYDVVRMLQRGIHGNPLYSETHPPKKPLLLVVPWNEARSSAPKREKEPPVNYVEHGSPKSKKASQKARKRRREAPSGGNDGSLNEAQCSLVRVDRLCDPLRWQTPPNEPVYALKTLGSLTKVGSVMASFVSNPVVDAMQSSPIVFPGCMVQQGVLDLVERQAAADGKMAFDVAKKHWLWTFSVPENISGSSEQLLTWTSEPMSKQGCMKLLMQHVRYICQVLPRVLQLESYVTRLGFETASFLVTVFLDNKKADYTPFDFRPDVYEGSHQSVDLFEGPPLHVDKEIRRRGNEVLLSFKGFDASWNKWVQLE